jgi:hypothetical protein
MKWGTLRPLLHKNSKEGMNMQLKLNVRTAEGSAKTYTSDTIDFSFGVVEDVLDALNLENLSDKNQIAIMVVKCSKQLRPFLKEIFEGVTDEELRTVKMSNLVEVFKGLYHYASMELGLLVSDEKN